MILRGLSGVQWTFLIYQSRARQCADSEYSRLI